MFLDFLLGLYLILLFKERIESFSFFFFKGNYVFGGYLISYLCKYYSLNIKILYRKFI